MPPMQLLVVLFPVTRSLLTESSILTWSMDREELPVPSYCTLLGENIAVLALFVSPSTYLGLARSNL